ncbi:hypothetical protein, partial [Flavonifractor plautii]|uniref:hypothetical protein n=2 Tax=Flavonifractor plautii TaxID=292800 RepID=UPI002330DF78
MTRKSLQSGFFSTFYQNGQGKSTSPKETPSFVGLSNKLDGEFARRKPAKRSHREVVRAAVMDSELLGEVIEGEKSVTG